MSQPSKPIIRPVLWEPNPGPQTYFLTTPVRECLYGGAVAGGKTDALVWLPLYRAWHPNHQGIILRRESKGLEELIGRQKKWYSQLSPSMRPRWYASKSYWDWPSGAKTWMGYAEQEKDIEKFKTFEFDLIEFEELTEFTRYQYEFMFSRNRTKDEKWLPLQIRSATNPGSEGMAWVFDRFIDEEKGHAPYQVETELVEFELLDKPIPVTRQFVPSTVFDNPKLQDRDQYIAGIAAQHGDMADAYLRGLWGKFRGQYFQRNPVEVPAKLESENYYIIRCMDYGWGDPTCILWLVVYPELGYMDIAGELHAPQLTTDSIAHMVKDRERREGWEGKVWFSVMSPEQFKSSEKDGRQSIPAALSQKGAWFVKANPDRVAGWARIALLISRGTLRMWEGRAPELKRTLTKLPRDENNRQDIKVRARDDHAAEALRYGVMEFWEKMVEGRNRSRGVQQMRKDAANRDPNVDELGRLRLPKRQEDWGLPGWT